MQDGKPEELLICATAEREAEVIGPPANNMAASAGARLIDNFRLRGSRTDDY